jgi:6-phosphogluconolactonase (cycloisomerase 2 family)
VVVGVACASPARAAAQASFAPVAGDGGCLLSADAFTGDRPEGCGTTHALTDPVAVAVSPDGRQVVVANSGSPISGSNGLTVFARDAGTGALSFASCVTDNGGDGRVGSTGACSDGDALAGTAGLAFSPDGTSLYATASDVDAVSWFSRDAATGALTQKGCIKLFVGAGERCGLAYPLDGASAIAVGPDGDHVFVGAMWSGSVTVFARDRVTGALAQQSCASDSGTDGACVRAPGLYGVSALAVSPDGKDVYATSRASGAIVTLAFDPASGRLAPKACLLANAPAGGPCTSDSLVAGATHVVITSDGLNLLVAAQPSYSDSRVLNFRRDPATGALARQQCLEDDLGSEDEDEPGASQLTAGCEPAPALFRVEAVTASADGRAVFAAGAYVAAFVRDPASGRIREFGCSPAIPLLPTCTGNHGITSGEALAASADGRSLYVVSDDNAIGAFGASVAIASRRVNADRRGSIRIRVECPRARSEGCLGRLTAGTRRRGPAFTARAGRSALIRVSLPARTRRELARHARARLSVTVHDRTRRLEATRRTLTVLR